MCVRPFFAQFYNEIITKANGIAQRSYVRKCFLFTAFWCMDVFPYSLLGAFLQIIYSCFVFDSHAACLPFDECTHFKHFGFHMKIGCVKKRGGFKFVFFYIHSTWKSFMNSSSSMLLLLLLQYTKLWHVHVCVCVHVSQFVSNLKALRECDIYSRKTRTGVKENAKCIHGYRTTYQKRDHDNSKACMIFYGALLVAMHGFQPKERKK